MALANLKNLSRQVSSKTEISIDEFIADAERYSLGKAKVVNLRPENLSLEVKDNPLKRATFTLGNEAIEKLNVLAEKTNISKSRLIRIWLSEEDAFRADRYNKSKIK